MKKITKYLIIPLFSLFAFFLFSNTKASAYSIDFNGNLVSDNLIDEDNFVKAGLYLESGEFHYETENRVITYAPLFLNSGTYTLSSSVDNVKFHLFFYSSDGTFISKMNSDWATLTYTFVLNYGNYVRFSFGFTDDRVIGSISQIGNIMLNKGSEALSYEFYGTWYSQENYSNYGNSQYSTGVNTARESYLDIVKNTSKDLNDDELITPIEYTCKTYTSGAIDCTDAFKGYVQDAFGYGKVVGNEEGINYADGRVNTDSTNYKSGLSQGYKKASEDGKSLGTFIPNLLGGFGSFFLTILNIDILGFNLLSIFGIVITIGIIILILKFMRG